MSTYSSDNLEDINTPFAEVPTKAVETNAVVLEENSNDTESNVATGQWGYTPTTPFAAFLNRIVPHGGAFSNIYSMAAVTLGSGIFSLPYAFRETGIFTAVIVLVAITVCTVYSVYILMQAVEKTGRTLRCYESLSRGLLGRGWDYLAAFNMWMFCFGSCVSYVISIQDLIRQASTDPSSDAFIHSEWGNRLFTILVWLVVMLPLCIPKQVNSLRYVSVVGVTFIMYFVVVVVIHSGRNGFENGKLKHSVKAVRGGNDAIVGFSTFVFAYLCQTNVFEVYQEMAKPSPARVTGHCAVSMAICTCLYIITGLFGYMDYGDELAGSMLKYYNVREDVLVAIGYVGLGFKLCVSFAICMQPTRDAVYYICGLHVRTIRYWLHIVIVMAMAVIALVLGLVIPDVTIVFGLVGSFCGGFLGFVFPALFIMYSGNWNHKSVGWFHWIATYALLIAGVIAIMFGTAATIYDMI